MQIIVHPGRVTYIAASGDWRLDVQPGAFVIQPQVGALEYASGTNLDNLAALIVAAKADAIARGINWSGV
jgi:hypothetical protein